MRTVARSLSPRWIPAVLVCAACSATGHAPAPAETSAAAPATTTEITAPPSASALATAIRQWEARAGDHFRQSAKALQEVNDASATEDESGLWSGCQQLHDTNSLGLQADLPTPDPGLTAELQRMIDDMNSATHACLRFVLGRDPADAANYQDYLARAVEHLRQAKLILNTLLR